MSNLNPNTMMQSGNGIAFGMRASGAYAMLPCSVATDSVIYGPTQKRHVDVAFEHNPGTFVWSPPT